jgi:uncharacterized protein YegP (UPF0339 family)
LRLPCFLRRRTRAKVIVFEGAGGWYFHARAPNGEIIIQSEAYTRREDAECAARALCTA